MGPSQCRLRIISAESGRWSEAEVRGNPGAKSGGHQVEFGLGRAWDAGEEMVCAFDEENLARLRCRDEISFERAAWAELIMVAGDEELGHGTAGREEVVTVVAAGSADGEAETHETADAGVSAAGAQADVGAEGEAGEEDGQVEAFGEPVECSADIVDFAAAIVVGTFAEAGSTEVETQNGETEVGEGLGGVIDDLVVHCATTEWVWMGDEYSVEGIRLAGVKQGLKATGGAAKVFDGLYVGAERRHRDECTWL